MSGRPIKRTLRHRATAADSSGVPGGSRCRTAGPGTARCHEPDAVHCTDFFSILLEEGDRVAFGIPPHDVIWAPRTSETLPLRAPRAEEFRNTAGGRAGDARRCGGFV